VVTDSSGVADAPADAELATPCPHSDKLAPTTTADTAATNLRDMALALLTLRVPHTALDMDEAAKREYSCRPRKEGRGGAYSPPALNGPHLVPLDRIRQYMSKIML
jgi:hypothetical protein